MVRRAGLRKCLLLLEGAFWLAVVRLAVLCISFRRIVRLFGLTEGDASDLPAGNQGRWGEIGWALDAAASRAPWHSSCLVKALAGAAMLRRRHLPAALFLGVAKKRGKDESDIAAHAWLSVGGEIITGAPNHESFAVLTAFRQRWI